MVSVKTGIDDIIVAFVLYSEVKVVTGAAEIKMILFYNNKRCGGYEKSRASKDYEILRTAKFLGQPGMAGANGGTHSTYERPKNYWTIMDPTQKILK